METDNSSLIGSVQLLYKWSTKRIETLRKTGSYLYADAIEKEFYEWIMREDIEEHEIYSFEII